MSKNFVILIGGPVIYHEDDPSHDKTWVNYIALMQNAARQGLYNLEVNEQVHWVVFEPPYRTRWADDSEYTNWEWISKGFQDDELHATRLEHADKVKKKGATNYVHRIKQVAQKLKIKYYGIQNVDDFWKYLAMLPNGSITRVWYSGHASSRGLFVAARHDYRGGGGCTPRTPVVVATDIISNSDIQKHKNKIPKFSAQTKEFSRFYGCNTAPFAEQWNKTFKVPSAGARNKVTFKSITQSNVLQSIETMKTSAGSPNWTEYR